MRYFLIIVCISAMFSCGSGKAGEFMVLLDSMEQNVFGLLVADSTESRRLQALLDEKPDTALVIGKTQAAGLTAVINKLKQTDVSGIENADALKKNTINYYQGLLRLKKVDILEAQMEALRLEGNSGNSEKAITDIANLARKRLEIHRSIGKLDEERAHAKKNFEKVNNLD